MRLICSTGIGIAEEKGCRRCAFLRQPFVIFYADQIAKRQRRELQSVSHPTEFRDELF